MEEILKPFDITAHGDLFEWARRCLRERLPAMIREVSTEGLVRELDPARLSPGTGPLGAHLSECPFSQVPVR